MSDTGSSRFAFYDSNKNLISGDNRKGIFTPTQNGYIRKVGLMAQIDTVQIENGNVETAYSPYREPITKSIPQAIIDKCPNYGIGVNSDCYNYIDFVEKKYHKRVGKRIFDKNSSVNYAVSEDYSYARINYDGTEKVVNNTVENILSNKLTSPNFLNS